MVVLEISLFSGKFLYYHRHFNTFFEEIGDYLFNLILFVIRSIEKRVHRRIIVRKVASKHFSYMARTFKMVILPVVFCYLMFGILLQEKVFDSLIFGLELYIYGNFLPDFDTLFTRRRRKRADRLPWFKKCLLLCFAPFCILMFYKGAWKIPSSETSRIFHNFKSVIIYGLFLFSLGFLLYDNIIETVSPLIFGLSGYLTHLKVDDYW